MSKPRALIVDVDGTLVDVSGARHYVLGRTRKQGKDFHHFHLAALFCPPVERTVRLVAEAKKSGWTILVVTARKRMWERGTRDWLAKHEVEFDRLFMRADSDQRKDVEVKRDILARIREEYDVGMAIDDNPNVIALWRAEGIPVEVVPGWVEEPA